MKNLVLFFSLLLLAALGCQSDLLTTADDSVDLRAKKMVPFHSETIQWLDPESLPADCGFPADFLFEGYATHLGMVTGWLHGYHCEFAGPVFTGYLHGAYVAANGDELWFDGVVSVNFASNPPALISDGTTFTGGTGRWANATGSATGQMFPTETPGVDLYIFDGEVSAPGK